MNKDEKAGFWSERIREFLIQQIHKRPAPFLIHGLVYMAVMGNVPLYCFYGGDPLPLSFY